MAEKRFHIAEWYGYPFKDLGDWDRIGWPGMTLAVRQCRRRSWRGWLPDVVPVIDHVSALPGLTVATGLSGHGFGIGPGMWRVVADLVAGGDVGHGLTRFRFGRFSDGSKIEGGLTL